MAGSEIPVIRSAGDNGRVEKGLGMEGSRLCSNPLSQRDGMQARARECAEQAGREHRARLDNHFLPPYFS